MKITLGEVGTYINGYAFKPSDWGTSGLPIIRIQNLTNQNTIPNYFDGPYNSKFEVNKGDILIAWSGSLGIHVWQKNKALLNQHIFRVEFNKCEIDKMYFYYAVKHNIHKMLHLTHGATMRHIIKSDFEKIVIPYPSLVVQAKISKILNYLEQNIINYRTILSKLDLLIKSRFVDMFGDPVLNEKGWNLTSLESVCQSIYGGGTPSKKIKEYYMGTIPWVTSKDMKSDIIVDSIEHITQEAIDNSSTKIIPPESVLIVIRSGILKHTLPVCINKSKVTINQDLKALVLDERCKGIYLQYLLKALEKDILSGVRAVTADNIEFNSLKKRRIPIPPINIQIKFSQMVNQINKLKSDVQKSIDETQLLMDSLMQEYFG